MSARRRLLRDALVYGGALGLSRGALFLLLPIYARAFTPEEYGAFDLMTMLMRALFVPAVLGIDWSLSLMLLCEDETGHRRATILALAMQLLWGAGVIIVLLLAAPGLARLLFGDAGGDVIVLVTEAYLAVQVANNFAIAIARWRREAERYFVLSVGYTLFSVSVSLGLVLIAGAGVVGALAGMAIGGAAFIPIAAMLSRHAVGAGIAWADMARAFRLGLPFAALNATDYVFPFLLRMALAGIAGLSAVGIFGAASTICLGVILISDAFSTAFVPHTLSEPQREGETSEILRLYACFLIVLVAALAIVAEPLVSILLGSAAYAGAAQIVGALAFANWCRSVRQNAATPLIAQGVVWARTALNLVPMAVGLALAYPLTLRLGVLGTAWGFAAGEAIGLAVQTGVLVRAFGQSLDIRSMVSMAALYLGLLWLMVVVNPDSLGAMIAFRLALGVGFLVALGLLRVVRPAELRALAADLGGRAVGLVRR